MSTENSDDEYLPGASFESDDSRVGVESRPGPLVTSRPPTRVFVINNPEIRTAEVGKVFGESAVRPVVF